MLNAMLDWITVIYWATTAMKAKIKMTNEFGVGPGNYGRIY